MNTGTSERMAHLFQAARQDGPSPEARVAMWVGIETASLSIGASGASATAIAAKSAVATSKLVLGLFLGAGLTTGVAGAVVVGVISLREAREPTTHMAAAQPRMLEHPAAPVDEGTSNALVIAGHVAPEVIELPAQEPARPGVRTGTTTLSEHDRLAREARMVNEARGALHRGEPELALQLVRAARAQRGARLVPEELTVEAQALRATGDEAAAQRIEAQIAKGELPAH